MEGGRRRPSDLSYVEHFQLSEVNVRFYASTVLFTSPKVCGSTQGSDNILRRINSCLQRDLAPSVKKSTRSVT